MMDTIAEDHDVEHASQRDRRTRPPRIEPIALLAHDDEDAPRVRDDLSPEELHTPSTPMATSVFVVPSPHPLIGRERNARADRTAERAESRVRFDSSSESDPETPPTPRTPRSPRSPRTPRTPRTPIASLTPVAEVFQRAHDSSVDDDDLDDGHALLQVASDELISTNLDAVRVMLLVSIAVGLFVVALISVSRRSSAWKEADAGCDGSAPWWAFSAGMYGILWVGGLLLMSVSEVHYTRGDRACACGMFILPFGALLTCFAAALWRSRPACGETLYWFGTVLAAALYVYVLVAVVLAAACACAAAARGRSRFSVARHAADDPPGVAALLPFLALFPGGLARSPRSSAALSDGPRDTDVLTAERDEDEEPVAEDDADDAPVASESLSAVELV